MFSAIRKTQAAVISKAVGALLIATSVGAGAAAADDSWRLTVNNTGSVPLKVVILDSDSRDITGDRSSEFIAKGSGSVTVKKKGPYNWEVFARGASEPCQKQRGASGFSITVQCEPKKSDEKPTATSSSSQQQSGNTQRQDSSAPSGSQTALQQSGNSGCTLSNVTSKGCPPKVVQEMNDLRKKADEADKALAQVEADIKSLGPNDKAKLNEVYQRYIKAKATDDYLKGMTGKQSGQPGENIDYKTKYDRKEDDLGKVLKDKARAILGCVPQFSTTSIGCERETNVGGGKK